MNKSLQRRITRLKRMGVDLKEDQIAYIEEKLSGGICEICGKERTSSNLCIDHNHKTNEFRGVICKRCNYLLGVLHDNAELLENMAKYLKNNP